MPAGAPERPSRPVADESSGPCRRSVRLSASRIAVIAAGVLALVVGLGVVTISFGRSSAALVHHRRAVPRAARELPAPPLPLRVTSVSPTNGARSVGWTSPIVVTFSAPLAPHLVEPSLSPPVAGTWRQTRPSTLTFHPTGYLPPLVTEHLVLSVGPGGPVSRSGERLPSRYSSSFTVAGVPVLRLQQLLAELDYLPVRFTPDSVPSLPTGPVRTVPGRLVTSSSRPEVVPLAPQPGTFSWRYPNIPSSLAALWQPGVDTALVNGAAMAFEADHELDLGGPLGAAFYEALLSAVATGRVNTAPYDYIEVSTHLPETLSVWQNGRVIYQSLTNTGIPEAPTAFGSFPVYARYLSTTMSGYNPDGSYYSDPGIPDVAYFDGGAAVHGYLRASYGYPQSLGCVELPYSSAAVVFKYDPIGTLVTVL